MSVVNKFFKISNSAVESIAPGAFSDEKSIQTIFEKNLKTLLGVTFLHTEYSIGDSRIDTLGIDGKNRPVIIEYKRAQTRGYIVGQIKQYAAALRSDQNYFAIEVTDKLDRERARRINWNIRKICIALQFSNPDRKVAEEDGIELIQYSLIGNDILRLKQVIGKSGLEDISVARNYLRPRQADTSMSERLKNATPATKELYRELRDFLMSLGDDMLEKETKTYIAFQRTSFQRGRSVAEICPRKEKLNVFTKWQEGQVLEPGFTADYRNTRRHGSGKLQVTINSRPRLEKAKPLFRWSYENSG